MRFVVLLSWDSTYTLYTHMYISYRSWPVLILMNFLIVRTFPTTATDDTISSETDPTGGTVVNELLLTCSEGVCGIFGGITGVLLSIILFLVILVLVQMMRYMVILVDKGPQSH